MSVIERCLAKQSGERFPSMAVIAHVLASFDGGVS
jgi:hypothetical protein